MCRRPAAPNIKYLYANQIKPKKRVGVGNTRNEKRPHRPAPPDLQFRNPEINDIVNTVSAHNGPIV